MYKTLKRVEIHRIRTTDWKLYPPLRRASQLPHIWSKNWRNENPNNLLRTVFLKKSYCHLLNFLFYNYGKNKRIYNVRLWTSGHWLWTWTGTAAYWPDLAPSDYRLFASMVHALAEQRFEFVRRYKKSDSMNGSRQKGIFTGMVFINYPKDRKRYNKRWSILWTEHFLSFYGI